VVCGQSVYANSTTERGILCNPIYSTLLSGCEGCHGRARTELRSRHRHRLPVAAGRLPDGHDGGGPRGRVDLAGNRVEETGARLAGVDPGVLRPDLEPVLLRVRSLPDAVSVWCEHGLYCSVL